MEEHDKPNKKGAKSSRKKEHQNFKKSPEIEEKTDTVTRSISLETKAQTAHTTVKREEYLRGGGRK